MGHEGFCVVVATATMTTVLDAHELGNIVGRTLDNVSQSAHVCGHEIKLSRIGREAAAKLLQENEHLMSIRPDSV